MMISGLENEEQEEEVRSECGTSGEVGGVLVADALRNTVWKGDTLMLSYER